MIARFARAVGLAAALLAAPAHAQTGDPHRRGEIVFERHANGLQYPRYAPARTQTCTVPAPRQAGLRQRLVDLAAQEWARFGYPFSYREDAGTLRARFPELLMLGLKPRPYDEDDPLLLAAIGGYWAALTGVSATGVADVGGFEIGVRNARWRQNGAEMRSMGGWATPWSAAFISWLMCEAGAEPFARSWAHRDYVDAAIAAADGGPAHLYHAHDPDRAPQVGDLVCASRADYRTDLAGRRAGNGADGAMHCDLVVALDTSTGLVLAIGGNVENGVSLAPYRLMRTHGRTDVRSVCAGGKLCPGEDERVFAVLVLQAPASDATLSRAPALQNAPPRRPPSFR